MIKRYDSVADLVAAWGLVSHLNPFAYSWCNDESSEDTHRKALGGDVSLVPPAEALLDKLSASLETSHRIIHRAPCGGWPSIPDYLMGSPTPMRRFEHDLADTAPIRIVSVCTSSAGLSAGALQRRGTAILALVLALSQFRPVTLEIASILGGLEGNRRTGEFIPLTKINTQPLDIATACYVLTSAGFDRRIHHDLTRDYLQVTYGQGWAGDWAPGFDHANPQAYFDTLADRLGYPCDTTLVIGGAHLSDTLLADPVAWVQGHVDRFTGSSADWGGAIK